MGKGGLEAFSDGVIAIIITIMVLELKVPHGATSTRCAPAPGVPELRAELHLRRHLLEQSPSHAARCQQGDGDPVGQPAPALLAVALPFATGWMGENHFAPLPTAIYGVVLLMAAIAYHPVAAPSSPSKAAKNANRCWRLPSAVTSRGRSRRFCMWVAIPSSFQ